MMKYGIPATTFIPTINGLVKAKNLQRDDVVFESMSGSHQKIAKTVNIGKYDIYRIFTSDGRHFDVSANYPIPIYIRTTFGPMYSIKYPPELSNEYRIKCGENNAYPYNILQGPCISYCHKKTKISPNIAGILYTMLIKSKYFVMHSDMLLPVKLVAEEFDISYTEIAPNVYMFKNKFGFPVRASHYTKHLGYINRIDIKDRKIDKNYVYTSPHEILSFMEHIVTVIPTPNGNELQFVSNSKIMTSQISIMMQSLGMNNEMHVDNDHNEYIVKTTNRSIITICDIEMLDNQSECISIEIENADEYPMIIGDQLVPMCVGNANI